MQITKLSKVCETGGLRDYKRQILTKKNNTREQTSGCLEIRSSVEAIDQGSDEQTSKNRRSLSPSEGRADALIAFLRT